MFYNAAKNILYHEKKFLPPRTIFYTAKIVSLREKYFLPRKIFYTAANKHFIPRDIFYIAVKKICSTAKIILYRRKMFLHHRKCGDTFFLRGQFTQQKGPV